MAADSLCEFRPDERQVSYYRYSRRKGSKDWTFNNTPDSNRAEQGTLELARDNPTHEFKLEKVTRIVEVAVVST